MLEIEKTDITFLQTPLGVCKIEGNEKGISSISILDNSKEVTEIIPRSLQECVNQLNDYFEKKRTTFNLKLNPKGTNFQQKVWSSLQEIPYGTTITYLAQAKSIGDEKAIRAMASANGKNPLWIVIPCHRVIGSDGSLTGYAGGLWRKKWLLEHEEALAQLSLFQ